MENRIQPHWDPDVRTAGAEASMESDNNPKAKRALLDGKAPMEYVPYGPMAQVAGVFKHGADKYGRFNWREESILSTTYVAAIARHTLLEWAEGVDVDHDSGFHPLAHVVASCLIVMDSEAHGTLIDDRLKVEVVINGETMVHCGKVNVEPAKASCEPELEL